MFDNINPETANAELLSKFSNFCLDKGHELIFVNCIDAPLFLQNKEGEDLTEEEHLQCLLGDIMPMLSFAMPDFKPSELLQFTFDQINKKQEVNTFYCFSAKRNDLSKYEAVTNRFIETVQVGDVLNIPELLTMILQAPPETD
jgi:hypothetical protein